MKMKAKIFLGTVTIVLLVFLSGCASQSSTGNTVGALTTANENLRVAEVGLPGMFCQACAQSSEGVFEGMPGVVDASVDIRAKKGTVIYDASLISKEQLVQDGLLQAYGGEILNDQEYNP